MPSRCESARRSSGSCRWWHCWLAAITASALGLHVYISFDALRENRQRLLDFVTAFLLLAPPAFTVIYAGVIALSMSGGTVLTMTGGFLFGVVLGAICFVMGGTLVPRSGVPDREDGARRAPAGAGGPVAAAY